MKNQKNMLMLDSMSKSQMSPGLCDPRDFDVMEAGEGAALKVPFHGQCGSSEAEYDKLLREGDRCANASSFSEQGEQHPNVNHAAKPHTPIGRDEK